jgi:demethylmenaquinone methyltransferase / 2-methoxy-6-polyprenyl-1,4-benzoquinol methylase
MANRYYQPGDQRAARVETLFNTIAPRYDLINDLQSLGLHRRWKRTVIRQAAPSQGSLALDVCCGTGDLTLGLWQAGARVIGVDFSSPMLAVGRRRMQRHVSRGRRGVPSRKIGGAPDGLLLVRADALRLPLPPDFCDVVTVGYGLRNLQSFEDGLREFMRVTRPGGRLLILDFGKPSNALWRAAYYAYLRLVVPLFGWFWCGDAASYGYIIESLREYPAQEGMARLLRDTGWERVATRDLLGGIMSVTDAFKPGSQASD